MKNPIRWVMENHVHSNLYLPLRDLSWGKRFHIISLFWMKIYGEKSYFVIGFLFLEIKLYFAPPKNKLSKEEILNRKENIFLSHMNRREEEQVKKLAKKLKISESSVKHLATKNGFIVEDNRITKL